MLSIPKTQTRFIAAEPQVDGDTITLSFASDEAIDRRTYLEILDLNGCDLSRVHAGSCAWLWNHEVGSVLGLVEAAWRSLNKLYAKCKAGNNPTTERYLGDIRSGIIPQTSCRYEILDHREEVRADGRIVVTITDWMLLEVSSVAIPADPSTGVGRGQGLLNTGEKTMPSAARLERARVLQIQAMEEKYGPKLAGGAARAAELAEQAMEEGLNEVQARSLFADEILASNDQQPIIKPGNGLPFGLGLSSKEQRSYSIGKAIRAAISGSWKGAEFELECSQELEKQGFRSNGILIPTEALRAPMMTTSATQAGNLVETQLLSQNFVEVLRASSFAYQMGATRLDGLTANVQIPRQASVSSLGWVAENADLPESAPTFDKISLTPKTVGAWTSMSRLMATQSDLALDNLILADFRNVLARELDRTAIYGTGASGQPLGILASPGIGSLAKGANGGVLTWDDVLTFERLVETGNALSGSLGFVTSPKLKSKLKGTLKNAVAGADYIWMDSGQNDGSGMLTGYRAMASSTILSNVTKGTGTNLSALVFGDWSSLVIATWGALSLEVDPYADFRKGTIALRVMLFADMAIRHPESFAACTDAQT